MKNMKIEVNGNLDEIVVELERLGYKESYKTDRKVKSVYADHMGYYSIMGVLGEKNRVTLSELKEMK